MQNITLITGPSRSGKSEFAEELAREERLEVVYVATSSLYPGDPEWQERIRRHQTRRPARWRLVETAGDTPRLESVLLEAGADECLLVDSLGGWLASRMAAGVAEAELGGEAAVVVEQLRTCRARVLLVSEETGWGVVPAYPAGRLFRDVLGSLNRRIAREARAAYLVVSGYALDLKTLGRPVGCHSGSDL